jgi:hypothetical protein
MLEPGFIDARREIIDCPHGVQVVRPFEQPAFLEGFALIPKLGLVFGRPWGSGTLQKLFLGPRNIL